MRTCSSISTVIYIHKCFKEQKRTYMEFCTFMKPYEVWGIIFFEKVVNHHNKYYIKAEKTSKSLRV